MKTTSATEGPDQGQEYEPCVSCPSLAVLGTMTDAGKSILTAGLCRVLTNGGLVVAPFKAQNMSNNSAPALLPRQQSQCDELNENGSLPRSDRGKSCSGSSERSSNDESTSTNDNEMHANYGYGEIGTAQALQAQACRTLPRVEMNPILLKSGGRRSSDNAYLCSIILLGKHYATEDYGTLGSKTDTLMKVVLNAHHDLGKATGADVIVIEGAGSCTELNLTERDVVNLPLVRKLGCPWILVANIDPGGVFAQIVGTKACVLKSDWDLCVGVIVNKLRGETKHFEPGPSILEEMIGKPVYVVPYLYNLHLPEEDGLGVERRLMKEYRLAIEDNKHKNIHQCEDDDNGSNFIPTKKPVIVVIAYPHVSITEDITPLESDSRFTVQWRRDTIPQPYPHTTAVILPGSRLTRSDLMWLQTRPDWIEFLHEHVSVGGSILGLCGGYQMLGMMVDDIDGIEGEEGMSTGLGFLPVHTSIAPTEHKVVTRRAASLMIDFEGTRDTSSNVRVEGFELRCGRTEMVRSEYEKRDAKPLLHYDNGEVEGIRVGKVCGTYMHGILRTADARKLLLGNNHPALCVESEMNSNENEDPLDRLAKHLEMCGLNFETVWKMIVSNKKSSVGREANDCPSI